MKNLSKLLSVAGIIVVVLLAVWYGVSKFRAGTSEPLPPQTMKIDLYFSNSKLDPPNTYDCSLVYPVTRTVPKDPNISRVTILELLKGPTVEEQAQGYTSFFSSATADMLQSIRVDKGTAYVDFKDFRQIIPNASASCGSAQFLSQVEASLKQYPGIGRVIYAIDKIPQTFYDFMQIGCDWKSTTCDGANFP